MLESRSAAEGQAAKAAESTKEMQEEVKLGYDLRVDALRKELAADAGRRAELEANMQVWRGSCAVALGKDLIFAKPWHVCSISLSVKAAPSTFGAEQEASSIFCPTCDFRFRVRTAFAAGKAMCAIYTVEDADNGKQVWIMYAAI